MQLDVTATQPASCWMHSVLLTGTLGEGVTLLSLSEAPTGPGCGAWQPFSRAVLLRGERLDEDVLAQNRKVGQRPWGGGCICTHPTSGGAS